MLRLSLWSVRSGGITEEGLHRVRLCFLWVDLSLALRKRANFEGGPDLINCRPLEE